MARGVTVDISARITGYEQSLNQLRVAINKLDPGSELAKSLNKGLIAAESQVKSLGKNLNPKFTSESQLDKFIEKINQVGAQVISMGQQLEKVAKTDLNFSLMDGFSDLQKNLQELKAQLNSTYLDAFKNAISSSKDLNEALQSIGFDTSKIESEQDVFDALKKKIEETSDATVKFGREYAKAVDARNKIEVKVKSLQGTIFGSADSAVKETKNVHDIADDFLNIGNLRERVTQKLKEQFSNKEDLQTIIDGFFDGLDGSTARDKLQALMNSLSIKKGDKRDFYKQIFGADDANARDIDQLLKWLNLPNIADVKSQLQQYTEQLAAAPKGISADSRTKILGFLTSDQIDQAVNELLKAISAAYKRVQDEIFRENNNLTAANGTADNAKNALNAAIGKGTQLEQASKAAKKIADDLKNTTTTTAEVRQVKEEVQQTSQTIDEMAENGAAGLRKIGEEAEEAGKNFSVSRNEAEGYNEALEKVHQREQLVGKIEGVVQRWFSIYAAVRMVGNAIRSVISTIKELDKTITDITIVTNMSREDLWGQMPQYTQMAQDYAVSISGVYQVSQLFYQQGLQTNDVLTLTGETLKMARIAGLDYAESTNYMTNALRSFKLEMDEASRVTDAYSVLAANAAVSVSEIAEAMSKTASSAYAVGSSLENTATMITVMTEATRESASNIGSALKSIISRYGEMTSNPKQLIDSEGEEMSLNKVDRALQSVEITLQDTQGQFRNFDDVIMELASVWDTLDNNTQRYIATIMAGNRQQSRFLALVSSYERYAELSEKAANAAGAGQEQFEKTLEGIEARTQQLQTSLQNLYTSAGLEELYGGLLTVADNILNYYNSISDAFGNGMQGAIAAVVTFGAQFYNIASIVTNVLKIIKAHYVAKEKEVTALHEAEEQVRANTTETFEEQVAKRIEAIWEEAERTKTKITRKEARQRAEEEIKAEQKISEVKQGKNAKQIAGTVGSGISIGSSIIGTALGGTVGTAISGFGGLAGGITQLWSNPVGGILSIVSSIGPLISTFKDWTATIDEYSVALKKNAEAQEQYKKKASIATNTKEEIKNLEQVKEKLTDLSRHRYDSADAEKAYYDYMAQVVELYPNLLQYYDSENRAISEGTDEIQKRIDKQKEYLKDQEREAYFAKLRVDTTISEREEFSNIAMASNDLAELNNLLNELRTGEKAGKNTSIADIVGNMLNTYASANSYFLSDKDFAAMYGVDIDNDEIKAEVWKNTIKNKKYKAVRKQIDRINDLEMNMFQETDDVYRMLASILTTRLQQAEKDGTDLNSVLFDFNQEFFGITDTSNSYLQYFLNEAIRFAQSDIYSTRLDQYREGAELFINQLEDAEKLTQLEKTILIDQMQENFEKQYDKNAIIGMTQNQFATAVQYNLANQDKTLAQTAADLSSSIYGEASEEQIIKLNVALDDLDNYTATQIDEIINGIEETTGGKKFKEQWKNSFNKAADRYKNALMLGGENLASTIFSEDQFYNILSPRDLSIIATQLTNINSMAIGEAIKDNIIHNYEKIWEVLRDTSVTTPEIYQEIENLFDKYDVSSISGIYGIIDNLPQFDGAENIKNSLYELAENVEIKFNTEFNTYISELNNSFDDFNKTLSNVEQGLSLNDAIKLADELNISIDKFNQVNGKFFIDNYEAILQARLSMEEAWKILNQRSSNGQNLSGEDLELYKRAVLAREQYYTSLRQAYLSQNRITDFLMSFDYAEEVDLSALEDQILSGDFSNLPEELQSYITLLIDCYNNTNSDVYKAFVDSITSGNRVKTKVTEANKETLSYFDKFIEGTLEENSEIYVNFSEATTDEILELRSELLHAAGLTEQDRASYVKSLDAKLQEKNSVLEQVIESYSSFDAELAQKYASSQGKTLALMLESNEITYDAITNTYSVAIDTLKNAISDDKLAAKLQDQVQSDFDEIGDLLVKAIEGTLNNTEGQKFKELTLNKLGINVTLQQLEKGLGTSKDEAIGIYIALQNVNSIAGQIAFDKLKDTFTAVGEECEDIYATMSSIAKLERELQKESNKENQILKNRLSTYKQIAVSQMNDANSYNFMNKSLPSNMQGAMNFWNSSQTMVDTMKEATENGYLAWNDFYNMATTINYWAGVTGKDLQFMGMTLNGNMTDFAKLIVQSSSALVSTEDGLKLSLESFGKNFSIGAADMNGNIQDGMKEFAQSQINILDGIIQYLETVVAMENLQTEGIDFSKATWFGADGLDGLSEDSIEAAGKIVEAATKMNEAGTEYTESAKNIQTYLNSKIVGENLTLYDVLQQFGNSEEVATWTEETKIAITNALNELKESLGKDFSIENILGVFGTSGEGETPKQKLELELSYTETNGSMADAEKFADLVKTLIDLDENGNVQFGGTIAGQTFDLSITNNGGKLTVDFPGYKVTSLLTEGLDIQSWLKEQAYKYFLHSGFALPNDYSIILESASTTTTIANDPTNSTIGVNIEYASKAGKFGKVAVGNIEKTFGPTSANYTTAEKALEAAVAEYINASGKITDYEIESQSVEVTNDINNPNVNVSIVYTSKTEGYVQIGDKKVEFGPKAVIQTAGAALEKAAYDYDQTYGSGTLKDIPLGGKTVNITSSTGINYQFEFPRDIQGAFSDIGTAWNNIDTEVGKLIEKAEGLDVNLQGGIFEKNGDTWLVTLDTTDITGTKTISYNFNIEKEQLSQNIHDLQGKWASVQANIILLTDLADTLPSGIDVEGSENNNGDCHVKLTDLDVHGEKKVEYNFEIKKEQYGKTAKELRGKWDSIVRNINDLKEIADNLPSETSIKADESEDGKNYTVKLETTDFSGEKHITYNFDVYAENFHPNRKSLAGQWASITANINTLRKEASTLPRNIKEVEASDTGDGYLIKFNNIDIGGNCIVTYTVKLDPHEEGMSAAEFSAACTEATENIKTYKDAYKDLMDSAGIKKLGIFKFNDGSLQLSADIHVGDEVTITWTSIQILGDNFETVIKGITDAKENLKSWKDEVSVLNTIAEEVLQTHPDPIEVDNSVHLVIKDNGVYFDNGPLAGTTSYNSVSEALLALEAKQLKEKIAARQANAEAEADKTHGSWKIKDDRVPFLTEEEYETYSQWLPYQKRIKALRDQETPWTEAEYNEWDELMKFASENYRKFVPEELSRDLTRRYNASLKEFETDENKETNETLTGIDETVKSILTQEEEKNQNRGDSKLGSTPTVNEAGGGGATFSSLARLDERGNGLTSKWALYKTGIEQFNFGKSGSKVEELENLGDNLGKLGQYIDKLVELQPIKSGQNVQGKNSKDPQTQLLITTQQMAEVSESNASSVEDISTTMSSVTAALDNVSNAAQDITSNMPEEPKASEWYSVFDGISVHGDFWGEGNQIVLSDGHGGNIHMNLKDYITQFNQTLVEMQQMASEANIVVDINANNTPFISKLNEAIARANRSTAVVKVTMEQSGASKWGSNLPVETLAKGNVALGKGTLMGELGPELYVTGGHYYIAGRSGAEFVNLPDDAIVFNHLQTQRLLGTGSSGRGHAITNEKKATSYATGNVAMASASDALAQFKEIRSVWQAVFDNLSSLATKAGRGGGGGGGKNGLDKGYIADLERWYNLLRKIEEAERDINYQEQLRNKLQSDQVSNGRAIYNSQKKQIELLNDEIAYHTELATLQERYYKQRQEDFKNSEYSRIFQLTDSGLLQYRDEDLDKNSNLVGLFALAALNETDASGKAKYTAEEQYNMLVGMNFGKEMQYTTSGEEINVEEEGGYEKAVETFWEKLNGWKDELDDLNDGYHEQLEAIVESETERNKLIQEVIDNQLEVENKVLEAIENREQAIIDELQDERNALADAADKYINGLNQQLSKEREMYEQQESEENLRKLRRQLGILERSGGSSSQISSLRQQIASAEQDAYFDAQQKQIDAIKEASDLELERLDHQIEIMQETLAYQKENGLFWDEVTDIMSRSPEEIMDFITKYDPNWPSLSTLDKDQQLKTLGDKVQNWAAYYEDKITGQDITHTDDWGSSLTTLSKISDTTLPEIIKELGDLLDGNGDIQGIDSLIAKLQDLRDKYGDIPEIKTLIEDLTNLKNNQGKISETDLAKIKSDVDSLLQAITGDSGVTFASLKQVFENELSQSGDLYKALERLAQALGYDISDTNSKTSDHTGGITSSSEGEKTSQTPKGDELWYYKDNNGNTRYARYDYIVSSGFTPIRRIDDKSTSSGGSSNKNNNSGGNSNTSKSTTDSSATEKDNNHGWQMTYNGTIYKVNEDDRATAETIFLNRLLSLGTSSVERERAFATIKRYVKGGLADYTGLAVLHGSKSRPEAVFTADQTAILRNDILSDSPNSLLSLLQDFRNSIAGVSNTAALSASGSIIIENASVNMNIDSIANDYDAQRAGEQALNRMLEIARKTNVQSLRR